MSREFSKNFEATLYGLEYSTTERATLSICKTAHIITNERPPLLTHRPSVQTGPLRLPSWPHLSEDKAGSEPIR